MSRAAVIHGQRELSSRIPAMVDVRESIAKVAAASLAHMFAAAASRLARCAVPSLPHSSMAESSASEEVRLRTSDSTCAA